MTRIQSNTPACARPAPTRKRDRVPQKVSELFFSCRTLCFVTIFSRLSFNTQGLASETSLSSRVAFCGGRGLPGRSASGSRCVRCTVVRPNPEKAVSSHPNGVGEVRRARIMRGKKRLHTPLNINAAARLRGLTLSTLHAPAPIALRWCAAARRVARFAPGQPHARRARCAAAVPPAVDPPSSRRADGV
jgi:hypothetical protein